MTTPPRPASPSPGEGPESPVIRLRVVGWDVVCTVVLLVVLVVVATATSLPSQLFGFLGSLCLTEECPPVPLGVDYYIYPVVWGGIGAAVAATVIGPVVSLVKGWYLFFWPVLAIVLLAVSSLAGSMLTAFSMRYYH